jgi:hypothetical protein
LVNTVPGRDAVNSNIGRIQGTLTHVSVNTTSTFTIRATSNNGNLIDRTYTMLVIPMTYPTIYGAGTAPPGGGTVQGAVGQTTKIWGNAHTLNTARYTVSNQNWEQVGWTTGPMQWLAHRNFAISGTSSATLFVPTPNGSPRTFGAGTVVERTDPANGQRTMVEWTVANRQLPFDFNPDVAAHAVNPVLPPHTPINLNPIWAPVRTDLNYHLGTPPPNSGEITPGSPLAFTSRTLENGGIRFTNQSFRFPADTISTKYTVSTGAIWEQIGWTMDGPQKYLPPLATLPVGDFAFGQWFPTNHAQFNTHWGTNRNFFPVWRRVITHGSVNVIFVGGPDSFMETDMANIGLSASMPFTVNASNNTINRAGTSTLLTLPSHAEMQALGQAQNPRLEFQGWFLRTSWEPAPDANRLTAIDASGRFTLPSTLWTTGIMPQNDWEERYRWQPYIWIEARWG